MLITKLWDIAWDLQKEHNRFINVQKTGFPAAEIEKLGNGTKYKITIGSNGIPKHLNFLFNGMPEEL